MSNNANSPLSPASDPQSSGKNERPALRHRNPQTFLTSAAVITRARDELAALTGYKIDSIAGFEKTEDGWRLSVTVVELHRIPASTDILATYEATLNEAGDIVNYHRSSRYSRSQTGEI
jgi:hypothetical protein